jgi:hypothetical protein
MSGNTVKSNIGAEFIGLCYERDVKKESLEDIFNRASGQDLTDLIFSAVDSEGNKPF